MKDDKQTLFMADGMQTFAKREDDYSLQKKSDIFFSDDPGVSVVEEQGNTDNPGEGDEEQGNTDNPGDGNVEQADADNPDQDDSADSWKMLGVRMKKLYWVLSGLGLVVFSAIIVKSVKKK